MKKLFLLFVLSILVFAGCAPTSSTPKLKFANAGWDSIMFHNAVMGTIIETVFGFEWEEMTGSTPITYEALMSGEIDIYSEIWTDNLASYEQDVASGRFELLGMNFDDNRQGLYVPRYVIEGDAERGIEPIAPNLRYVSDLPQYWELFKDEEDPSKGRLYGGIPGWAVDSILRNKFTHLGLDATFNYFSPGSDAALSAALSSAYTRGEAIVGYYWEPTWLMGLYDFVLLEDEPFNEERFMDGVGEFKSSDVTIGVRRGFSAEFPEVAAFLSRYRTSSTLTSEALSYIEQTGSTYVETAKWFILNNQELVASWLSADQFETLMNALNS
jgi:glycine betaine/proline transport system permease protein/glycine betaine/proline transport system substrate-binding protein